MDNKILVFDMDGTIANFYGVKGWLDYLINEDTTPYEIAEPLYDMDILNNILKDLKNKGWKIVVTTWLAKYNFPYDEIHLVKYGTTKANCTRKHGGYQILVDDNETVRKGWKLGHTINANNNILTELKKIA